MNHYTMKSKIKSQYNDLKDDLYLTLFILVPFIIILNQTTLNNIIIPLLLLMVFIIAIKRKQKKIILFSFIIIIIILIPIVINEIIYYKSYSKFNNQPFNDECQIIDLVEYDTYQKITFQKNKIKFIGNLKKEKTNQNLLIGMKVKLKGTLYHPNKYFLDPTFNYQDYLKKTKINGFIQIEKITIINQNIIFKKASIKNINLFLNRYIDKIHPYESKEFLKNLILGTNSLNQNTKENLNKMGISHLFVVSGMHFSLLILIFDQIFNLPFLKNIKNKKIIKIIYLFSYVIITKFTISIMRCFIQNIIKMYNNKLKLNKFNQFSLSLIIAIIIQPFSIFNTSFHLTYLISGSLVLLSDQKDNQNKILKTIKTTIILNLIILPLLSNFNSYINLMIVLFNFIYIPLVTNFLFPFSFITLFIPFFNKIYYYLYYYFNKSIELLSNNAFVNFFNITLPKTNSIMILIYYIILIIFLIALAKKKKIIKSSISLLIILLIWNNYGYLKNNSTCEFLNVKIGDVTLIKENNLKNVILIDTGDDKDLITYLKKQGIKKIDLIIISHSDRDHNGQLQNLIKNFKIKTIMISEYDQQTKSIIPKSKLKILKKGQVVKIGKIIINCLAPLKNYQNTNENSLVIILIIKNIKILFTGDITKNVEEELIKKYQINVDILKVAHHGSNTSSSQIFLQKIKFKTAIAMNGYQNNYQFPNQEVIERFKNYSFHNTKNEGTIILKIN